MKKATLLSILYAGTLMCGANVQANDNMVVPADNALGCLDCHGDNGRLDWKALGYSADPMRDTNASRTK